MLIAMFTLKQLRAALALAETSHFGRAAERCHITQPALSQQIRLLEDACGTPLFDRRGKTVRATPFGREFVARARRAMSAADDLEAFATAQSGLPDRPLRFGLIPTVAPYLLPDIFPVLRDRFPALAFTISESRTGHLIDALHEASIDLALIATDPPEDGPRLAVAPLFVDGFVLATGEHDDLPAEPVRLADLPPERILLLDEGHCFRDQALAACGLKAAVDRSTFAATSLSTIVEFVANGQGVTLLPEIALRKEAADARIRIRRLEAPGAARTLSLVWREASPFAETFAAIAGTIREAALLRRPAPAAA
jgi:LysR family transcriptional regulator, hydrogen peroxide-inducible genes activator